MRRGLLALVSAAVSLLALAPTARAWTDARVVRVTANVDVARSGEAHVLLAIGVRVRGGWLQQLELVGLDPGLALLPEEPPTAVDADGMLHRAAATVADDGRVVLAFDREDAPHRGDTVLNFAYRARVAPELEEGSDVARVRWTLPSWEGGLDEPVIVLRVPGRATVPAEIACPSCTIATEERDGSTTLTLRRTHLPRATPWDAALDLPRDVLALPAAVRPPPLVPRAAPVPPAWPTALALAAALALLGLAKRGAFALALSRRDARGAPRPWLAMLSLLLAVGGAALALRLADEDPLACAAALALVTLAAVRGAPEGRGAPRPGAFRPVTGEDLAASRRARRAAWLSPAALLDATTPPGAVVLGALGALGWWAASRVPASTAAVVRAAPLLALPLFVTSTRFQLPTTPHEQLALLARIARHLALPGELALSLVLHEDGRGRPQEARLSLVPAAAPDGLVRLDVAIAVARGPGGFRARPFAIAVTSSRGRLERALADALPEADAAVAPGGRRVVRVVPLSGLRRLLVALGLGAAEPAPPPRARRSAGRASAPVVSSPA